MFGLFKKEPLKKIQGKIERIGTLPNSEFSSTHLIKLKDCPTIFECYITRGSRAMNVVMSKEGDEVSFAYDKKNELDRESFVNSSFTV